MAVQLRAEHLRYLCVRCKHSDTQTFIFTLPNTTLSYIQLSEWKGASQAYGAYQSSVVQSSSQTTVTAPPLAPNQTTSKYVSYFVPNVANESITSIANGFTQTSYASGGNGSLLVVHQLGATTTAPVSATVGFSLLQSGLAASLIIPPAPPYPYVVQTFTNSVTSSLNASGSFNYPMNPGNYIVGVVFQLNGTNATNGGGWTSINSQTNLTTSKILTYYWKVTPGSYAPTNLPSPIASSVTSTTNWFVYTFEVANIRNNQVVNLSSTNTGGVTGVSNWQGPTATPTWNFTLPILAFITNDANPQNFSVNGYSTTASANTMVGVGNPFTSTQPVSSFITYTNGSSSANVAADLMLFEAMPYNAFTENLPSSGNISPYRHPTRTLTESFVFADYVSASIPYIISQRVVETTDYFDVPFYQGWHVTAQEMNNLAQYTKGAATYIVDQSAINYNRMFSALNHAFQRGITVGGQLTFTQAVTGLFTGGIQRDDFAHSMQAKTPLPLEYPYPSTIDPNVLYDAATSTGIIATLTNTNGQQSAEYINGLPPNSLFARQVVYDNLGNPNLIYGFLKDTETNTWNGTYLIIETIDSLNNTCLVFVLHYSNLGTSPNILYNGNLIFNTNGTQFGVSDNPLATYQSVNFTRYQLGYYSYNQPASIGATPANQFYGYSSITPYASAGNTLNSASTYLMYINPFFQDEDFFGTATCLYGLFYPNTDTTSLSSAVYANHLSSVTNTYVNDIVSAYGGTLNFLGGNYSPSNIPSISINHGPVGTLVTLSNVNPGAAFGVYFGDLSHPASELTFVSEGTITFTVPPYVPIGPTELLITNDSFISNFAFTVQYQPTITALSVTAAAPGATVNIYGYGFGPTTGIVYVDTFVASVQMWSDTQLNITVPQVGATGSTQIKVVITSGQSDNQSFVTLA